MTTKEIPVLLLTGYLGSGKTTLVNHILANKQGIRFAVIVNDIGEVNIDADLIQKGGVVGKKDESLVALQNGCICCTLKTDLIEQIGEIMRMERFDYIVIEASGICEPEPIAQTICSIPRLGGMYTKYGICRLDCITTVVDALRLQSEFSCGDDLTRKGIDEEDIENLIIRQIEFCNIILLNKAAEVKPEELERIKLIIRTLQPAAEIIECNYADVNLEKIIHTGITATMKTGMRILTKNTSTVTKRTDTIITITKGAKWKSTASALSFTTAVWHSTFTNSTTSSPPDGAATSSVPKAYAISATTATCPTSLNRQAPRSN